jgi:hypothetical protein
MNATQTAIHHARRQSRWLTDLVAALAFAAFCVVPGIAQGFLPSPVRMVSTVPPNGDVNPYGVAFVPSGFPAGTLQPGDILVSNFNNVENLQGTGTTIMHVPQSGSSSVFYQSSTSATGLSDALGIVRSGFILVGSFPTADGTCATAQAGSVLVLNSSGQLVQNISGSEIDGPWGMAINDRGSSMQAFVTNALNGTVTRLDFQLSHGSLNLIDTVQIASGYRHQCDPAALVDAPTGMVYDVKTDTLYVASTLDNAVFAVPQAGHATQSQGTGSVIYSDPTHLHGALSLSQAPSGHLLVTNNDVINQDPNQPSEIVEFTGQGQFVKEVPVDPNLGGSFGLQAYNFGKNVAQLAAVDDNIAGLFIWTLPAH